jgi:transcription antitermination protein NusB
VKDSRGADEVEEGPRHEARERALALLYEADLKGAPVSEVLGALAVAPDPFAERLVRGASGELEILDAMVGGAAVGWEVDRMPVLDRWILRIATYELLEEPEVPVAVVIDEAVELAKLYSTEDSGRFINGVLSEVARRARS